MTTGAGRDFPQFPTVQTYSSDRQANKNSHLNQSLYASCTREYATSTAILIVPAINTIASLFLDNLLHLRPLPKPNDCSSDDHNRCLILQHSHLPPKMATQTVTELQAIPSRKSHEPPAAAEAAPTAFTADDTTTTTTVVLSKTRAVIVITQLLGLSLFSSFCNGIIVVGLPSIATTLHLQEGLLLWPTSVFYLTAGSCLLMAGSIADVAGAKRVNLMGSFLGAAFALACGLARTGGEFIAFRALQGVANAIIVPSSISIISTSVEDGRPRNMGFGCLGFAGPIGFSLGLVLGGVFVDSTGWRPAFYLAGAASFVLFLTSIWTLPQDARPRSGQSIWKRLASEIDWVGAILASTGLATLSYVLA